MVDGQVWVRMGRRLGCVSRPQAGGREHSARRDPSQKKEGRVQPECGAEASSQRIGQKPAGVIESELGGEDRRPILGLGRPTQQPAGRSLGEAVAEADDQPEHHRGTPHRRAPRARLARWRPPLSGRDAPARCRLPRPRRDPGRGQGRDPHRDTLLRLFPRPHPGGSRPGDPRPLGDREPPATSVPDVTPSPTTSPASARDTAPGPWPPSDTSPSISSEPPRTNGPASAGERSPDGTPATSKPSSPHDRRNLDSEPCDSGGRL